MTESRETILTCYGYLLTYFSLYNILVLINKIELILSGTLNFYRQKKINLNLERPFLGGGEDTFSSLINLILKNGMFIKYCIEFEL